MWPFDSFGGNSAMADEYGGVTTYAQLSTAGKALAAQTDGRALAFILCANEKGSVLGYTAFVNAKIVPLLLDAAHERESLCALIDIYKPDYLWLPQRRVRDFPAYRHVCSVWEYALLKTPYKQALPLNEGLALLLTTSGSTGSPKLVRLSYTNVRANAESIAAYLRLDGTERAITTLPMHYTYGLSIINSHFMVGASVILTQKTLMQKEFWRQFTDFNATSFGGVPYIYEMLDKLRFFRMDLPTLRTMTQAGGRLSPALHRKFAEYAQSSGKKFVVMYGQTEATARMSYLPAEMSLNKCGSIGIAIPGGRFNLTDANGNEITEAETVGELVYKGANVMLGYAESGADLSKGDELNAVLATGDMAKRDADGFYYIVGRKKRFLKIFGSRINLDETERLLSAAFPAIECACGGTDDNMAVFITNGAPADNIMRFLTKKTGFNRSAFHITTVGKIPRNNAGKILYSELNRIDG